MLPPRALFVSVENGAEAKRLARRSTGHDERSSPSSELAARLTVQKFVRTGDFVRRDLFSSDNTRRDFVIAVVHSNAAAAANSGSN